MMKKIAVHIITGFLGSGKTTVISNLLQNKAEAENWALIINEFGQVAIDHTTLQTKTQGKDPIIEVSGGCICCSSKAYFQSHLNQIVEKGSIDRILIEPTGLGGVQMVEKIISQFIELELQPVICLVDVNGQGVGRLRLNQIYLSQIRDADIIAISKCDLEGSYEKAELLENWIKTDFPTKRLYTRISNGIIDQNILAIKTQTSKSLDAVKKNQFIPENKLVSYKQHCFTFAPSQIFNINRLHQDLMGMPHFFRAKGFLNIGKHWVLFNYILGTFNCEPVEGKDENLVVVIVDETTGHNTSKEKLDFWLKQLLV